jgi:hypothetical protein
MKLVKPSTPVWVWIGVGIFFVLILAVQFFLTVRQEYPHAVSDEVTERSRSFVEQTKHTLEESNQPSTP